VVLQGGTFIWLPAFPGVQGIRIVPDEKDKAALEGWVWRALLPFFKGPFVDPQLAREDGPRAT